MRIDGHVHAEDYNFLPRCLRAPQIEKVLDCAAKKGMSIVLYIPRDNTNVKMQHPELGRTFQVIPGVELEFILTDLDKRMDIAYISDELSCVKKIKKEFDREMSIDDVIKVTKKHQNDARIVFTSPILNYPEFYTQLMEFEPIVEVHNGTVELVPSGKMYNIRAQMFADKHKLPMIAGSDAKSTRDIGSTYKEIDVIDLDAKKIFSELVYGKSRYFQRDHSWYGLPKQVARVMYGVRRRSKAGESQNIF